MGKGLEKFFGWGLYHIDNFFFYHGKGLFIGGMFGCITATYLSMYLLNYIPSSKGIDSGDINLNKLKIEAKDLDSTGIKEPYLVYEERQYRLKFDSLQNKIKLESIGNDNTLK